MRATSALSTSENSGEQSQPSKSAVIQWKEVRFKLVSTDLVVPTLAVLIAQIVLRFWLL